MAGRAPPLLKKDDGFTVNDVRRADLSDLELLEKLINRQTNILFGNINQAEILDKCHKTVCLENSDGEAVAFLCLDSHPNIPSIPPYAWTHWLYSIYQLETITPRNSLWIHLVVWDRKYTYTFLAPILKSVFGASSFLEYVIMVVPPGISKLDWLEEQATRILPPGFSEFRKVQTLYILVRQNFVCKYKIRRAVEEDNDDLVPLIHAYSKRLQQSYGEFYIAEILTRHPDSGRKLIVAEYEDKAVAVMFLNEVVNIKLLNDSFELVAFYGLRKPHEDDIIENRELQYQLSDVAIAPEEYQTEDDLLLTDVQKSKIEKEEEEEGKIEEKCSNDMVFSETASSEDSADDVTFLDVDSAHLIFDISSFKSLSNSSSITSNSSSSTSSNYSAIILSFNDYETNFLADKSLQRFLSVQNIETHNIPKHLKSHAYPSSSFHGELNAFCLEIAAALPAHEHESLSLLLEAAFECFPDKDYCVLSLPSTCPPFPLLRHFCRASPRPMSTYPYELYILHRNSILSKIYVRLAESSDIPIAEELVKYMTATENFMNQFICAVFEHEDLRAYLLLSEDQVVGVAVLREEENFEYLKSHYELSYWLDEDNHKSGSHGLLEELILSPVFQRHACFFLREIHRLSDFSVIYYRIFPSDTTTSHRQRSLCCVMGDLIAVRPRPNPEFNHSDLEGCSPPELFHRLDPPFALYVSTARHCNIPRYEINTKIVVVGSSDIALAFLESLICSWSTSYHITFTNVTVISPHGLSHRKPYHRIRDMLFVTKNNYDYRYINLICLKTYVNHIAAAMTGIERKNKLLIVNDNKCVAYDLLFLMCGIQFQRPASSAKLKKQKVVEFPQNVMLINTDTDAMHALTKLKKLIIEHPNQEYNVVVYGCVLEAYCCLAALLEVGIPGENITFIESYPDISENKSETHHHPFPDPEVDEAVHDSIKANGIKIYQSFYFVEWTVNKDLNRVTSVKFESRNRRIEVNCIAMFMYNDKTVSARTFLAINQSGLVFDGALVIGPDCKTNDPNIYAAGTVTKYCRRYYADHMEHKYYNLEEIGWKLGQQIRKKLIPFFEEDIDQHPISCKPGNMLVPEYHKPLMSYCRLPGDLRYLSVTKPGKPIPLEVAMSSEDYGQVFVTGDCKQLDKQGYFRLHLNQYGVVETITCLAKFDFDRKNLVSLWGKHEKLLNNLQTRFEMVFITDLYEYFRQPWSCAIFHDRFPLFEKSIRNLMTLLTAVDGDSPVEDLIRMFKKNEWEAVSKLDTRALFKLSFDQREEIEEKFANSQYQKIIEQKLLKFLLENITFLPMYAHPIIIRMLQKGCEHSPLFEPQ